MKDLIKLVLIFTLFAVLFNLVFPNFEMTDEEIYVSEETNFLIK